MNLSRSKLSLWRKELLALTLGLAIIPAAFAVTNNGTEQKVTSSISATHYVGAKRDIDAFTDFRIVLGYSVTEKLSLGLDQIVTKVYVLDPEQNEIEPQDTLLKLNYKFSPEFLGLKPTGRLRFYAPTSRSSRLNDINGHLRGGVNLAGAYFDEATSVSIYPNYGIYFNEYNTTPTVTGNKGGSPLRRSRTFIEGSISQKLLSKFTAGLAGGYGRYELEEFTFGDQVNFTEGDETANTGYYVDAYVNYEITDKWAVATGYLQSENAEKDGWVEYNLFDNEVTRYYFNTAYSF